MADILLKDETLYILDKRLQELTGKTLQEVVAYALNEEYRADRKRELQRLRDRWRTVRAQRAYRPAQRKTPAIKRLREQGW